MPPQSQQATVGAALDLLVSILQQRAKQADTPAPSCALERGVTEDEHSAALKLLEVGRHLHI